MEPRRPKALLIGENPQGSSYLTKYLQERGCECEFALSYQEASWLLRPQVFDLVLSPMRLRGCSLFPLIELLDGSGITLFYSPVVENGCWWLPALRRGQHCFGSSALRPNEFVALLEETIKEIQRLAPAAQGNKSLLVFRADGSAMSASRPRAKLIATNPARVETQELVKRKAAS